jgi:hypothetical protein
VLNIFNQCKPYFKTAISSIWVIYFLLLNFNLFALNHFNEDKTITPVQCVVASSHFNDDSNGILPISGGAENSENEDFKKETDNKFTDLFAEQPHAEFFRYNSTKSATFHFGRLIQQRTTVSLIILYHSWKGYLH